MPSSRLLQLLVLSSASIFTGSLAFGFYRSTSNLEEIFRIHAKNCPYAHPQWLSVKPTFLSIFLRHPPPGRLLMITISRRKKLQAPPHTSYRGPMYRPALVAVFAEHPRERITSELALEILMRYCRSPPLSADFVLIPIANRNIRREVDSGASCERLNHRSVDLNRNYLYSWGKSDGNTVREEEAPGQWPLSESETSAIDMLVQRLRPAAYMSVHSGDRAVLVPWDSGENVGGWVLKVAESIRQKHCLECRIGSSQALFGYRAYGTGVDHMFGVRKVPFASTLEIYGSPKDDCHLMFNPATDEAVAEVLRNWSSVLDTIGREVRRVDVATSPWYSPLVLRSYDVSISDGEDEIAVGGRVPAEGALFVVVISFLAIALRRGLLRLRQIGIECSGDPNNYLADFIRKGFRHRV